MEDDRAAGLTDATTGADLGRARILIVDDDRWAVRFALTALREYADVRAAYDAAEAAALIAQQAPDLILLDAEMPGEDGFAFCRRLKDDPSLRDIPIIFVTSHTELEFEVAALSAGAADFISKPYSQTRLQLRVRLHLQLKWQVDRLGTLATTDEQTQVANRRAFERALQRECARSDRARRPLALLLFDLDHFALYNDRYGRLRGDECLRMVAAAAAGIARRRTDLVARYGAEEFAVLLPEMTPSGATELAARLLATIRAAAIVHDTSPVSGHVTISIGVACVNPAAEGEQPASDPELLTRAAEDALDAAKRAGRDRVVVRTV